MVIPEPQTWTTCTGGKSSVLFHAYTIRLPRICLKFKNIIYWFLKNFDWLWCNWNRIPTPWEITIIYGKPAKS